MKQLLLAFAITSALLLPTASPSIASAQTENTIEESYRSTLLALITALQQQIAALQAELERRQGIAEDATFLTNFNTRAEVVAVYEINNPAQISSISTVQHRAYFSRVYELFPAEYSAQLAKLKVFRGDEGYFDAFIETIPPEHKSWQYSIHERALKDIDSILATELIVHELGHLVSYEAVPGRQNLVNEKCHLYFERYGCPPLNSYLDQFVKEFWSDTDLHRAKRSINTEDVLASAQAHYQSNPNNHVTDYAALNPEEDFSESFMYFVLNKKEEGSLAAKKIDFFSQYSKLRSVREQILQQL